MSANSSVCTLQTCPLSDSNWGYRPSLAANGLLIGLFGLSGIAFLVQLLLSRRFFGFGIAFIIGCAMELAGYIGRVMSYYDPFSQVGTAAMLHLLPC